MFKTIAHIKLYEGDKKRKNPFYSGYRPLFKFNKKMNISGRIDLLDAMALKPGEEGEVFITFLSDEFIKVDTKLIYEFTFSENPKEVLGEGYIISTVDESK